MRFTISCKIFKRLSIICTNFTEDVTDEARSVLSCIRLENRKGKSLAIVGNQKIGVVEHIGLTTEPDGVVHLVVNDWVLGLNDMDMMEIVSLPDFKLGTIKTMLGLQYPGNACIYPEYTPLDKWYEWMPDEPLKQRGPLFMNLNYIELLNKSSPSGKLQFPEIIDVEQNMVLRDINSPVWLGFFTPRPAPGTPKLLKNSIPDWWN